VVHALAWLTLARKTTLQSLVEFVTGLSQGDPLAWGFLAVMIALGGGVTWRAARRRRW
jgi:hypothetical protein